MKLLKVPVAPSDCRQLRLLFNAVRLSRLSAAEQNKVRVLAQILMQAAGLIVEGLGDDGR